MDDFERRAEDVSVDHPDVVQHYRAAHDISIRLDDDPAAGPRHRASRPRTYDRGWSTTGRSSTSCPSPIRTRRRGTARPAEGGPGRERRRRGLPCWRRGPALRAPPRSGRVHRGRRTAPAPRAAGQADRRRRRRRPDQARRRLDRELRGAGVRDPERDAASDRVQAQPRRDLPPGRRGRVPRRQPRGHGHAPHVRRRGRGRGVGRGVPGRHDRRPRGVRAGDPGARARADATVVHDRDRRQPAPGQARERVRQAARRVRADLGPVGRVDVRTPHHRAVGHRDQDRGQARRARDPHRRPARDADEAALAERFGPSTGPWLASLGRGEGSASVHPEGGPRKVAAASTRSSATSRIRTRSAARSPGPRARSRATSAGTSGSPHASWSRCGSPRSSPAPTASRSPNPPRTPTPWPRPPPARSNGSTWTAPFASSGCERR